MFLYIKDEKLISVTMEKFMSKKLEKLNKIAQLVLEFSEPTATKLSLKISDNKNKQLIIDWFLSKPETILLSYSETRLPYGERKNSKKRDTTTWYKLVYENLTYSLGHITKTNYEADRHWASKLGQMFVQESKDKDYSYQFLYKELEVPTLRIIQAKDKNKDFYFWI
jgi:hypothetical protein